MELSKLTQSVINLVEITSELLTLIKGKSATVAHPQEAVAVEPQPAHKPALLNTKEVLYKLKTSASTLYRWTKKGLIKAIPVGKFNYYDPEEIDRISVYFLK